mgnify:CR=1 FL=1
MTAELETFLSDILVVMDNMAKVITSHEKTIQTMIETQDKQSDTNELLIYRIKELEKELE